MEAVDKSKHGSRYYGEHARRIAALYYVRRSWSLWQRVLWYLVWITPFEVSIILNRQHTGLYLLRATLWPRLSDVAQALAKRLFANPVTWWRLYPALALFWLAPKLRAAPPVFLHYAFAADTEDELHSHPWPAVSLILSKGYTEEKWQRERWQRGTVFPLLGKRYTLRRRPGTLVLIQRDTYHRILTAGWFSLFVPGPRSTEPEDESWHFKNPETGQRWTWVEYGRLKSGRLK